MKTLINCIAIMLLGLSTNGQVSVTVELVAQHEGIVGSEDLTGMSTYRIYLQMENDEDLPLILFGKDEYPLTINTSTTFFQSILGNAVATAINPAIPLAFPSVAFDSWVTIGAESQLDPASIFTLSNGIEYWESDFEEGQNILIDGAVGGGWFADAPYWQGLPWENGKVLFAQVTTDGNIWGEINLDYTPNGEEQVSEAVYGLTFGSPDETIIGCTDENALNYDPEATVNFDCEYPEGDLNSDGTVNINDVLDFLNQLGCTIDCGDADLNGDGVVDIWDLLMLLGFFG
jgi:hypothetical protein